MNTNFSTKIKSVFTAFLILFCLGIQGQTVSKYILTDQFGYRPAAKKTAVLRNPMVGFDSNESFTPGATYRVVDVASGESVFQGTWTQFNGSGSGGTDAASGDQIWWFDFSSVTKPGEYYILDVSQNVKSYNFRIAEDVYNEVLKHAVRTFYYQRAGHAKAMPYSLHADWSDAASHVGNLQDKNCRLYPGGTGQGNAATERDLHGGWYDAGDYNKYTAWTCNYIESMMLAYLDHPEIWTDDFNIPESGNGIPDLLDEAKWGLDWVLRMQAATGNGSVLSVMRLAHNSTLPPSRATAQSFYGPATTIATWAAAKAFALSSKVYRQMGTQLGRPEYVTYANQLQTAAINAFTWAEANLNVTFDNNANNFMSGSGNPEVNNAWDRVAYRVSAALYLFEITGTASYHTVFSSNYTQLSLFAWSQHMGQYWTRDHSMLHYYLTLSTGTPAIKTNITNAFRNAFVKTGDYAERLGKDGYRSFVLDYNWGSNQYKSDYGLMFWLMAQNSIRPADNAQYFDAAEDYIHYIHGVNPFGMVYLTNMTPYGASKSATKFYHEWFGAQMGNRATAPGYLTGGPNRDYDDCCNACAQNNNQCITPYLKPRSQPDAKMYKDINTSWPLNSWEITENSNGYQMPYIRLLAKFAAKPQVKTPEASVPTGSEVEKNSTVTLSTATADAKIYYTTNGSEPSSTNGTEYTAPITFTANVTIKAIAVKTGVADSEIATFQYTVIEEPDITPVITILTHPAPSTVFLQNNISGALSVSANVTESVTLRYQWYSNTTGSNVGGTPVTGATGTDFTIPTNLTAGTYYYFCEVSAPYAVSVRSDAATVTVFVPTITILTHPAPLTVVPQGNTGGGILSVSASVAPNAALTYQWYSSTTNSNTGNNAITGATNATFTIPNGLGNGSTTYYFCEVRATDATPVRTNVATVTVSNPNNTTIITISQQPVSVTVTEGSISGNLSVTATVNRSTLTYQWYFNTTNSSTGGTIINGATNAAFAIPTTLTAGTYYYYCILSTATQAPTPMPTVAATVTVKPNENPLPVITINTQPAASTSVTEGSISGSLTVEASVTLVATVSYQWFSNTSNSNTGGTAVATGETFTIPTTLTAGTYYYYCVVSATDGAISVTSNVATVSVASCKPDAGITNNSVTTVLTCTTPSISLTATGGVTYLWDNGLGSNANANVTAPGTYTVTVTAANGCSNTASITITEDKTQPTVDITNNTGTTVLTCTTLSINLTAITTSGGTYAWSHSLGTNANATVAHPDTYTVTITGANGCTNTSSIQITQNINVSDAYITNNTGTTELTCTILNINLTAGGGVSYVWDNGLGNNASVSVTSAGTYTVTVTGANGCTNTESITITEDRIIPTVNKPADQSKCNGEAADQVTFTSNIPSGVTYSWTNSNAAIGLAAGGSGNIMPFTTTNHTNAPITATITVTPAANGCSGSPVSFTITVNPVPTVNNLVDQTKCNGAVTEAVDFTSNIPSGVTYSWTNSNTAIGLSASGAGNIAAFYTANPTTAPIIGTITVTPTHNSCQGIPESFTVTVNPTPTVAIVNNTGTTELTCTTTSISLTATGGVSYEWSGGLGNNASVTATSAGTYMVTATDVNGCTNYQSITITEDPDRPTVSITNNTGATTLTCTTPSISLTATGNGDYYTWSNGLGNNATATVITAGTYTVTATQNNGCKATASITISEDKTPPIFGIDNNTGTTILTCTTPSISLMANGWGLGPCEWNNGLGNNAVVDITTAGTYTVTVTSLTNGCTDTQSITIEEDKEAPTAGITNNSGGTVLTCTIESISLTATGGGAYAWSNSLGSNADVTIGLAGTYTVTVTAANGCTDEASITITAEQTEYTVSFDDGSGNEVLVKPACQGITITKPEPDPTRRGYNFAGWYQGSTLFDFNTLITTSITLTAEWNIINYNIIYVLDGGINHLENPLTYNVESNTITLQNPTKDNYNFAGWIEGAEIPAGSIDAKTFTAQWTPVTGVADVSAIAAIQVYPNPVETELYIKLPVKETTDYVIFSQTGQIVQQGKLQDNSTINVQYLPAGVYYLRVLGETVKVIKN